MHPLIAEACRRLTNTAQYIRHRLQRRRRQGRDNPSLRHQGARTLEEVSRSFIGRLEPFSVRDLDTLAGCLTRLESVVRTTPPSLRQLRGELARRLGIPGQAEALGEFEAELSAAIYTIQRGQAHRPERAFETDFEM
jgi:hypothetical protein